MSKVEFARDKLRAQLSNLIDEYEAMIILLAHMNRTVKTRLDAERAALATANKRQLQLGIDKLSAQIKKLRSKTGATQPLGIYRRFLEVQVTVVPQGEFILSLPAYLALSLFSKYPRVAKSLEEDTPPPHAAIEIDYRGRYEPQERFQFHILEAMLFEDMCMFWNEATAIRPEAKRPHSEKIQVKRLAAVLRAAVSSAFYMVEAFCNGIAVEVVLSRRDSLTDKELQRVTEWDAAKGTRRFVSVRDKLFLYPRLLVGAPAPLVQENNSPELSYFLSSAKEFRDAIVHANPAPDYETLAPQKSQTFMRLNYGECAKIIDCSVSVIEQISTATGRRKSVFWLQHRQENGLFDE